MNKSNVKNKCPDLRLSRMALTVAALTFSAAAVLTVLSLAACKNSGEQTVSNGSSEASEVSVVSVSESQPSEKEKQESGASLAEQLLGFWTSEDENGYINVKIIENGGLMQSIANGIIA